MTDANRWDPHPGDVEVRDVRPYDYQGAKRAIVQQSRLDREADRTVREAFKDYAEKERRYRVRLSKRIVELKAEGMAVTVAGDVARGEEDIAQLKYERDCAEGGKEAALAVKWANAADRRELEQLVNWSMRVDLGSSQDPAIDAQAGQLMRSAA